MSDEKAHNIVIGQNITDKKIEFAREQRKEMSPVERVLWQRIRSNQLNGFHFRRQQIIAGFIADFYCHQASLAIEVDGNTHDNNQGYDIARDRVFFEKGIKVSRFTNAQVFRETDVVIQVIVENLEPDPK